MCCLPARRSAALFWPPVFVVSVCLAAACSNSGSGAAASAQAADALITIEVSDAAVTVVNKTGTTLVKAQVELVSSPRPFSYMLPRMQNGQKVAIAINDFRGQDGTPFRRGIGRVQTVKVTGTDLLGKTHEYQVPFR